MPGITVEYLRQQRAGEAAAHLHSLLQKKPEPRPISVPHKHEVTQPVSIMLHRRADIALKTLTPEDQKLVTASIHRLKLSLRSVLASGQAQRVNEHENLYVMKASDLRILFLLKEGEITVEDIYSHERLKHFAVFG